MIMVPTFLVLTSWSRYSSLNTGASGDLRKSWDSGAPSVSAAGEQWTFVFPIWDFGVKNTGGSGESKSSAETIRTSGKSLSSPNNQFAVF